MPSVKDRTLVNFTVFMLVNVTVFMPIFTSFYPFLGIDIIDILIYILYVYYELFRILPMTLYKTLFPISPPLPPVIDSQRGRRGGERGEEEVLFWGRARLARKYRVMDSHRGGRERGKRKFCFGGG